MPANETTEFLIKKFRISEHRLRAPMPIELPINRNDLAKLFNELGYKKGAEIGVAEGHYSEMLCQSIPDLELLSIDPWMKYKGNPRAQSNKHQDFSKSETARRLKPYPKARMVQAMSLDAVKEVPEGSLDFAYLDGHHSYDWIMRDLIEWSNRVRSGGCIAGDDYFAFGRADVMEAVQSYTRAHEIRPWFIIAAPQSIDFFWVKE